MKDILEIIQAHAEDRLESKSTLALTSAVTTLEDLRFGMIQRGEKEYQPVDLGEAATIENLRSIGDHINGIINGRLNTDCPATTIAAVGGKATTRMTVQVETTGSNLTPVVAALIDELPGLHSTGHLKAKYLARDVLGSPIWSFELTAPQLTLDPLFRNRNMMVNALTVRRSGTNCVATATITIMS